MSNFSAFRLGSRVGTLPATRARAVQLKERHKPPRLRSSTEVDSGFRYGIVPLGQFLWENSRG